MGEWTETYQALAQAYAAGGPEAARHTWEVMVRGRPELARLFDDHQTDEAPWPERQPLPTLPTVPTLPESLIPSPLRPWLVDVATMACIPLEYVAAPAIVALGALVGRALGIRPGRYDDYTVVPNLWGGIIGRPGTAKYRSLMPALALLFHLGEVADDGAPGPVPLPLEATKLAAAWCDYLELHAHKVYAAELTPGIDGAHTLADKIQAGMISHGSPLRDLYRPQWSGLRTPAAVEVLTEAGWVRTRTLDTGGRSSEVLYLHPDLRGGPAHA